MALKRERSFPTLSAKPWKDTQWRTHMPSEHSLRLPIHTPGRPSQRAASTSNAAAVRMTISSSVRTETVQPFVRLPTRNTG